MTPAIPAPNSGSVWRHIKSNHTYLVVGCGVIEATLADVVIYRRYPDIQNDPRVWVRPLAEFMDGRFRLESEDPRYPRHFGTAPY